MADISAMKHHQMQVLATRADVKHLRGSSMFPRLSGKVLVSGAWHSRKKNKFQSNLTTGFINYIFTDFDVADSQTNNAINYRQFDVDNFIALASSISCVINAALSGMQVLERCCAT